MSDQAYQQILPYIPPGLREEIAALPPATLASLEEVRLRAGYPVLLRGAQSETILGVLPPEELRRTVLLLSDASLYAFDEELRRGYITLPGGHRAGLTGRAVLEAGRVRTLKEISGVNLRLARPIAGVGAPLLPALLDAAGRLLPTLLISPPRAGKTTLLRDLAQLLADGKGCVAQRVSLVDERSELAAMRAGVPQFSIGLRSDVLDGCPKAEGMMLMLRSMSPDVLVTDEIGREEDARAVRECAYAGVSVLVSAHAADTVELRLRPALAALFSERVFQRIVILSRRQGPGTIERVEDAEGGEIQCRSRSARC